MLKTYTQNKVLSPLLEVSDAINEADHIDIKTIDASLTLREFLAGFFNYQPGWVTFLYRIRWGFVRLLGMKQEGMPRPLEITPEDFDFTPGAKVAFFTVEHAQEDDFILISVTEKHLKASLGVIVQPLSAEINRFHVITIVYYRHWTGIIYFNTIRPFHHLVVHAMMKAGTNYKQQDA